MHPSAPATNTALTVNQLNQLARDCLQDAIGQVLVTGEISNLATPASGHIYFVLKDDRASIRCAFFRGAASRCRIRQENGMQVRLSGKLSIYAPRGDYQLIVDQMEAEGAGDLMLRFEALKARLAHEGLFDPLLKKTLPRFPCRVAIVTSASAAALQDALHVFERRSPWLDVWLVPTPVQGREGSNGIVQALKRAEGLNPDVILLCRGGGALEDLWCFNEEVVARAISRCNIPLITGIGHETDFTIADMVADVRAPTPSAAAETLTPGKEQLCQHLDQVQMTLDRIFTRQLEAGKKHLAYLEKRLQHPARHLAANRERLDIRARQLSQCTRACIRTGQQHMLQLQQRLKHQHPDNRLRDATRHLQFLATQLNQNVRSPVEQAGHQLRLSVASLQAYSPMATLSRGYSILTDEQGNILNSVRQVQSGQLAHAQVHDGQIHVRIIDSKASET
jgi:exodeoxyribonuclease VII large subunit